MLLWSELHLVFFVFVFVFVVVFVVAVAPLRKHYFTLIGTIVEQMLFDGKGIDPDFRGRYRVNIDKIVASFVDEKKFKIATDELAESKAKVDAAYKENEKLDNEWADKLG